MSLRIDASEYFTGLVIGETGLGVLAENIPATGDSGASFLYNDVTLPADNGKEIRGEITTWPASGTLVAYEDGSFEFSGAPDGVYSFGYQLYVDGVATGAPVTVTLAVGPVHGSASGVLATITMTAPNATALGTTVIHGAAAGALPTITLTVPLATATGTNGGSGLTLSEADINAIAAAVLAALQATTIPVDVQKTNGVEIIGIGTVADRFRSIHVG